MKSRAIICAIAAACLSMSSLSFAQGQGRDRGDRDRDGRPGQSQRDNDRRDNDNRRDNNHRRGSDMGNRGYDQPHYGARGAEWRRGGHVPNQYRSRQYVVDDWRGHHLNAPPRGHQWVQVGGDYVLMAIATGVIVQLLLNQ